MSAPSPCEAIQTLLVDKRALSAEQQVHAANCPDCGFFAMLSKSRVAGGGGTGTRAVALAAPGILAGLEIRERLGGGAFGTVFKAWQPSLQRFVAVKWIPIAAGIGQRGIEQMRAEGIALGQLRHPNVLGVFDSGVVEGAYYVVTELAEGSLRSRAADVPRDSVASARFLQQVLMGLEAAHAAGIVHCDVKPENILVQSIDGVPVPKLGDFGLARVFQEDLGLATADGGEGGLQGTPAYAAPELWRGEPSSIQSDLFAAGVAFFELLTGSHPFPAKDAIALRRRIETGPPPSVRALAPAVSEPIARVVEGLLAKDPARRPKSARAAADAIEEILARRQRRVFRVAVTSIVLVVLLVVGFVLHLDRTRRVSEAQLARILQLADAKRLDDLTREAAALWPARPETAPGMEAWLVRAKELEARIPLHRKSLTAGWDHSLESVWQRTTLEKLVGDLEAFTKPAPSDVGELTGIDTLAGVERRLAFARTVEGRSVRDHAAEWATAIAGIAADPRFAGLAFSAQVGLVPLGADPQSGLQEFADVQTGAAPVRGRDGRIAVAEETSVVFVLLPAGKFRMGAGSAGDDLARKNEGPVHEVVIERPFLLSKYEMTQGQWRRFTGANPSQLEPSEPYLDTVIDLRHPVESVSSEDCDLVFAQLGFALPSEAQWEYAARAGTTTRWWTGDDTKSLGRIANVADRHAAAKGGVPGRSIADHEKDHDDGWSGHAPVGTFAPSPFGLHETAGNVWEWVRDPWRESYAHPEPSGPRPKRVIRGGGWRGVLLETRPAYRDPAAPGAKLTGLGVRPMRPFDDDTSGAK